MDTQNATEKQFTSDADLIMWMDINQVLYAEGLLPSWKQKRIQSIPGFKWDASHVTPAFRAFVVREQHAYLAEFAAEIAEENKSEAELLKAEETALIRYEWLERSPFAQAPSYVSNAKEADTSGYYGWLMAPYPGSEERYFVADPIASGNVPRLQTLLSDLKTQAFVRGYRYVEDGDGNVTQLSATKARTIARERYVALTTAVKDKAEAVTK
jgi:hypothetical protein